MRFSVVIPAHNESALISACVLAVGRQTVPRVDYEIIVVDNNSTDETAAIARSAGADLVVAEHETGTNIARQRGVRESSGDIVAFLDADCVPPPDWLKHVEGVLARSGVAAVSGPYDYGFTGFRLFVDRVLTHVIFAHAGEVISFLFRKKDGVLRAGNFAAWRRAIDTIGGLPPVVFWGDDTAIGILFARRAGRVVYDPTLIVKSSPRRFEGTRQAAGTLARYLWYHFKVYFSREY